MSISESEEAELEELEEAAREMSPEDVETVRGQEAIRDRVRKAAEAKQQITIRLDADIVTRFKELAGPEGSYQTLINRALREWLDARSVRRLLREWLGLEADPRQTEDDRPGDQ